MAGQPKKFKSGEELIELFRRFCEWIVDNGYEQIPSQTNFCKYLEKNFASTDRKTIYNALNEYFPQVRHKYEQMQSDLIAEGAMLGKWHATMSIFVLKNWSKWRDTPKEDTTDALDKLGEILKGIDAKAR